MWSNISAPRSQGPATVGGALSISSKSSSCTTSSSLALRHNKSPDEQNHQASPERARPVANSSSSSSPLMRYKHAICSSRISASIFIHGGRFGNLPLDDDLWRLDAHESTWRQLRTSGANKPPCLQEHSLVEYNDHLYLFGGQVSASQQEENFWRLDLGTLEWQTLTQRSSRKYGAHLGPTNRRAHSAVVYKHSMYVFGGYEDLRGSSSQLWQYDLLNERWELRNLNSRSTCLPEARHGHSAIVHGDSMYIYGGLSNLKPLSDLWRWCWPQRRWFKERTRGQSPGQLYGHSAIEAFGSMFVFGGERGGKPRRSLWRLDLSSLSWQKIRAKGPGPSPTCWHAAIANPLSILDEANYIIESETGLGSSLSSSNCFNLTSTHSSSSASHEDEDESYGQGAQLIQQQTTSIKSKQINENETIPLTSGAESKQEPCLHFDSRKQQLRRKLRRRLSFLSRRKKGPVSSSSYNELALRSNSNQRRQNGELQSSLSASENLLKAQGPVSGEKEAKEGKEVVMMSSDQEIKNLEQKPMESILDSLDTDIKQMFEASETGQQQSVQTNRAIKRDSMTQSQLYSTNTFINSSSYQTAREHLTSSTTLTGDDNQRTAMNSTMTLTQDQVTNEPATSVGVGARRRRRTNSTRSQRPRSEIVQSLIDRADARIKHLYTPFFQNQHQQPLRVNDNLHFDANDSLMSKLQNHRMFDRPSCEGGSLMSAAGLSDKSKRHTIHQTMTYYNLYFSEEARSLASAMSDDNDDETAAKNNNENANHINAGTPSQASSNCRHATNNNLSAITSMNSTTAALVGIRDGRDVQDSSSSQTIESQKQQQHTDMSSGSQTICSRDELRNDLTDEPQEEQTDDGEELDSRQMNLINNRRIGAELQRHKEQQLFLMQRDQSVDQMSQDEDNTSLSFSVIAEFEEDDMLQYSSPTDPSMILRRNRSDKSREQSNESSPGRQMQVDEETSTSNSSSPNRGHHSELHKESPASQKNQFKSSSSGYESSNTHLSSAMRYNEMIIMQQSANNGRPVKVEEDNQLVVHPGISNKAISSRTYESSLALVDSNKRRTNTGGDLSLEQHAPDVKCANVDASHHQQNPSKSLPSSPPDKRGHVSNGNGQGESKSTFVSRSSRRLFGGDGKRKSKTRYWQLCMFVIGGKQDGSMIAHGMNEPISIWRLYI